MQNKIQKVKIGCCNDKVLQQPIFYIILNISEKLQLRKLQIFSISWNFIPSALSLQRSQMVEGRALIK